MLIFLDLIDAPKSLEMPSNPVNAAFRRSVRLGLQPSTPDPERDTAYENKTVALCWCRRGKRVRTAKRLLCVASFITVVRGKQSIAFNRAQALQAKESNSFTALSADRTLDLEVEDSRERDVWVSTLEDIVTLSQLDPWLMAKVFAEAVSEGAEEGKAQG